MSVESISQRFRIYPPTNKEDYEQWLKNMAGRMCKVLEHIFFNGGDCDAELERCESWLQNHWDKK